MHQLWKMSEGVSDGGRGEQTRSQSQECHEVYPLLEVYESLSDKGFVCLNCNTMKILGNIIWLIFGGLHTAIEYFIAGLVLMITIIGIPFGLQSMKLGVLAIWPFGSKVKWKQSQPSCLSMFMNVLWFFVGGIWICLTHIFYGLLLCITIIGIPWGKMHFRLAKLALSPFGMEVV